MLTITRIFKLLFVFSIKAACIYTFQRHDLAGGMHNNRVSADGTTHHFIVVLQVNNNHFVCIVGLLADANKAV